MSSDRQAVFQATKVRTNLKKDGSWIHRSQEVLDNQLDVKCKPVKLVKPKNELSPESSRVSSSIMPCSQSGAASSSLDLSTTPQSSYVMSALRKFEPGSSTQNTPVKSGSYLAKSPYPVLEDSKRAHVEAVKVKPVEELLKTPADAPVKDVAENNLVKPAEEPLKTHADVPVKYVEEKHIAKSVEEPLKTPADAFKKDLVEKTIVKPVEEPLKTPADALKKDVVEKTIVKPVEKPIKTPADAFKKDVVEKTIVKPIEEPLKTPADAHVDGTGKTTVGVSIDQRQSSGALQEKTAKTLHENPPPSGALTTEKKDDNPVERLTTAHAPVVETPLEPKQAENQPTSNHGELSLVSALKTPTTESSARATTEPTEELVEAPAEQHRLNSEAGLNVKGNTTCSFCKLPVNGKTKITINIPDICCHPDCFKCNDCSSPLGDLSSSMYHYAGKVLCKRCFDQIFQL